MRLSDARLRHRQSKPLNPHHRPPCFLTEAVDVRSLEPIVRRYPQSRIHANGVTKDPHLYRLRPTFKPTSEINALPQRSQKYPSTNWSKGFSRTNSGFTSSTRRSAKYFSRSLLPGVGTQASSISTSLGRTAPSLPHIGQDSACESEFIVPPNDQVERREVAPRNNEAVLSQSSTPSLAHRRCRPAIARTVS